MSTPGPWRLRLPSEDNKSHCIVTDEAGPWVIADMVPGVCSNGSEDQMVPNGRLLAAAPDYHAQALALMERHDFAVGATCGCIDCTPFRAIYRKAEGP